MEAQALELLSDCPQSVLCGVWPVGRKAGIRHSALAQGLESKNEQRHHQYQEEHE